MTGVISSIFGDNGADAAIEAARIQSDALERANQQSIEMSRPYREAAIPALAQQQALLGLSGQAAQQSAVDSIMDSPGQRFIRQRTQRNLLQNAAAIGGIGGGNIRSALVEQGAGFAAQDLENHFNRLQALSFGGQQAATNQAGLSSNLISQAGQAQAQGVIDAQRARAGAAGQLLQIGGGALAGGLGALGPSVGAARGAALALISDENLKADVRDLSPEECYNTVCEMKLKSWRYIDAINMGNAVHFGVMAQDAPDCIKIENMNALDLHDELSLIAGAIQYLHEKTDGGVH